MDLINASVPKVSKDRIASLTWTIASLIPARMAVRVTILSATSVALAPLEPWVLYASSTWTIARSALVTTTERAPIRLADSNANALQDS